MVSEKFHIHQENFLYDNLNQLTNYAGKSAMYYLNGNIDSRSDVGTFQYNVSGKPYAVSGITSPTNAIPLSSQSVTYNSFKRPASLSEDIYAAAFTAVVHEYSYDAWGRLRNPTNQTAYTPGNEPVLFLGRGYTGHEHLTQFGLINMNARLYDPAVGRFLAQYWYRYGIRP
ncbi:hypothetical protein FACS189426_00060 [Bacteroidia bacterium]|nr:hypothetical protein FACS189426_00060 [Bacteroidia bacterium]GHT85995.1 hypothetical protein FACS18947_5420 [Bacteroidia bacterium]